MILLLVVSVDAVSSISSYSYASASSTSSISLILRAGRREGEEGEEARVGAFLLRGRMMFAERDRVSCSSSSSKYGVDAARPGVLGGRAKRADDERGGEPVSRYNDARLTLGTSGCSSL